MNKKVVITISREYGSGGRKIAALLAKSLNIPYYDKELLSKEMGKVVDDDLAKLINTDFESFDFYLGKEVSLLGKMRDLSMVSIQKRIYEVQKKLICDLAKDSCVIVGRCADYILKEDPDAIHVFIRADIKDKCKRAIDTYKEEQDHINEKLLEIDTKRSEYYEYFTGGKWGRISNYDLVLSTSKISIEDCVKLIEQYVNYKQL